MSETSPLVEHAKRELRLAELDQPDADYGGAIATQVLALIELFASQGHSGGSAMFVLSLFDRLARFKALTPLASDPAEWIDRSEMSNEPLWQNRRQSSVFSRDGGQTWYDLELPDVAQILADLLRDLPSMPETPATIAARRWLEQDNAS